MDIDKYNFQVFNYGFVRLVDVMGDDAAIVQAARTSYGKGTKTINEDKSLIRYLMRNRHTSPFEMVEFKFHIKLPVFVARQWIRHRTANVNEYSGRYSEMPDEFYIPSQEQLCYQSKDNKQGRANAMDNKYSAELLHRFSDMQTRSYNEYKDYIDNGMAREIARINLPLSVYTEWYWKIDLHNLFHFLKLRLDKHAQYEIRVYAEIIANIVKEICPLSWEAFEDYELNSIRLSQKEMKLFADIFNIDFSKLKDIDYEKYGLSKSEHKELEEKIKNYKQIVNNNII